MRLQQEDEAKKDNSKQKTGHLSGGGKETAGKNKRGKGVRVGGGGGRGGWGGVVKGEGVRAEKRETSTNSVGPSAEIQAPGCNETAQQKNS